MSNQHDFKSTYYKRHSLSPSSSLPFSPLCISFYVFLKFYRKKLYLSSIYVFKSKAHLLYPEIRFANSFFYSFHCKHFWELSHSFYTFGFFLKRSIPKIENPISKISITFSRCLVKKKKVFLQPSGELPMHAIG